MSVQICGGFPVVRRLSVPTTGIGADGEYRLPGPTNFLQVANEGANIVRIYFTKSDYDADVNYVELAATTGYFEGPVEIAQAVPKDGHANRAGLFLRAVTGTTNPVTVVAYMRRG